MVTDLLWADINEYRDGWTPSRRGISFEFGNNIVEDFLERNDLKMIVRAH